MSESKSPSDSDEQSLIKGSIPSSFISSASPESGQEILVTSTVTSAQISMSGPLPPPEVMRAFGQVDSSFPERIMRLAEGEAIHRRELERELLDGQIEHSREMRSSNRLGQWLGFVIAIVFLGGSVWATLTGHDVVGGVLGGTTIVSLVVVFVTGRPSPADRSADSEDSPQEK